MAMLNDTVINGSLYLKKNSEILYGPWKTPAMSFEFNTRMSKLNIGVISNLQTRIRGTLVDIIGDGTITIESNGLLSIISGRLEVGDNTADVNSTFNGTVTVNKSLYSKEAFYSTGKTRIYSNLLVSRSIVAEYGENCFSGGNGSGSAQDLVYTYVYSNDIQTVFANRVLFAANVYFHNPAYQSQPFEVYMDNLTMLNNFACKCLATFYSKTLFTGNSVEFSQTTNVSLAGHTFITGTLGISASQPTGSAIGAGFPYGIQYSGNVNINNQLLIVKNTSDGITNLAIPNALQVKNIGSIVDLYISGEKYYDTAAMTSSQNKTLRTMIYSNLLIGKDTDTSSISNYTACLKAYEQVATYINMSAFASTSATSTANDYAYYGVNDNFIVISGNTIYNPYYCNYIATSVSGSTVNEISAAVLNLGKHTGEDNVTGCIPNTSNGVHRVNRQIIRINGRLVFNFKGAYGEQPPEFFYDYDYSSTPTVQLGIGPGQHQDGSTKWVLRPIMQSKDISATAGSARIRHSTKVPPVAGQIYFQTID